MKEVYIRGTPRNTYTKCLYLTFKREDFVHMYVPRMTILPMSTRASRRCGCSRVDGLLEDAVGVIKRSPRGQKTNVGLTNLDMAISKGQRSPKRTKSHYVNEERNGIKCPAQYGLIKSHGITMNSEIQTEE